MKYYCELVNKDFSPTHKHVKANCTTRALTYILNGVIMQHLIARKETTSFYAPKWNYTGIWDKILLTKGYIWVLLKAYTRRDKVATLLKSVSNPIVSHSSGHVAIINNGAVIDTWDSRAGKLDAILIKDTDLTKVKELLGTLYSVSAKSYNHLFFMKSA